MSSVPVQARKHLNKKIEHHYVKTRKQLELQAAALQQKLSEASKQQQVTKNYSEVRIAAFQWCTSLEHACKQTETAAQATILS
jgi:hypothetical protein